jgi:small subunit ribosomal protein S1
MDQNETLQPKGSDASPQGEPPMQSMESLLANEQLNVDIPQAGEIRKGIIASISPSQVLVSIGAKSEGVISGRELEQLSPSAREELIVGAEVPVYVQNPEDENGNVVVSLRRAQEQMSWENVEKMLEEDGVYESSIVGFNKGGLIAMVAGLRGFVPSSQISGARRAQAIGDSPEQRWQKMVGEPITVRIIEVDRERRRLILSERAASAESRQSIKERVIDELELGNTYNGRVTSLSDFGAFVNINGADGLVHLSELAWERVQHPRDVLEVGQDVQVKVINIDREKKRIGLSLRALADDPWKSRVEKFTVGQLVEGSITRLTKFGAFARLEGDIEGLIHISEMADHRIEHPKEIVKEGEVRTLRIVRIDPEQHRIGLSLRKVDSGAYADKDYKNLIEEFGQTSPDDSPGPSDDEPGAPAAEPPPPDDEPSPPAGEPEPPEEEPSPPAGEPEPPEDETGPAGE